jgi:hypothetical protein
LGQVFFGEATLFFLIEKQRAHVEHFASPRLPIALNLSQQRVSKVRRTKSFFFLQAFHFDADILQFHFFFLLKEL